MCDAARSAGRVSFVGAGPGGDDLVTVRGARRIAEADVVAWPANAVPVEVVRAHARPDAELVDCSRLSHEQLVQLFRRAAAQRLAVARVLAGDGVLGSGLQQQYDACRRLGLQVEVVPGVAPLAAVLAAAGRELAEPAVHLVQHDAAAELDGHAALAVTASGARAEALVDQLRAGGRPDDTPVLVGYRPSRPDQLLLATTLGELVHTVKQHRLWLPALFLVGRAFATAVQRAPAAGTAPRAADGAVDGVPATTARAVVQHQYRRRRRARQPVT